MKVWERSEIKACRDLKDDFQAVRFSHPLLAEQPERLKNQVFRLFVFPNKSKKTTQRPLILGKEKHRYHIRKNNSLDIFLIFAYIKDKRRETGSGLPEQCLQLNCLSRHYCE